MERYGYYPESLLTWILRFDNLLYPYVLIDHFFVPRKEEVGINTKSVYFIRIYNYFDSVTFNKLYNSYGYCKVL
ncbi:hypothetical protein C5S32_03085 [ANME-1 cluster archaeon GoMg1]|nr:hypothetical protein [ANME-1 cluster archaeon GoMg1]